MKRVVQDGTQSFFKRGAATLCLLSLLSKHEMYGYELVQAMDKISEGRFCLPEGTLYYKLSEAGMRYYEEMLEDYHNTFAGVEMILNYSDSEE